ncbi:Uncharacterized protein K02A2.6 [Stylophora pistillata]|uniref:Uncharacterized protein K02A2.6 n=1 Tax=Stylophora pistillata TaxID=50429 RepID=A0A2B4SPY1_STYPI|nr:Uncharacterized protein K02A2.6 [Stylophora pistillata]
MAKDLGSVPLQKSNVTLRSYSGHSIPVYGETAVHVKYGSQELDLPIIVTNGKGVALMGRDWLSKIKLNWHHINAVRQANQPRPKLEDVVQQYPKLFDGKLGTITGFTAQLKVKENATPQYFKSRPMPYALREKVEKELKRLVKEGVLKKVESSDWATPIVPVLKPDGTVRICGDFKLTINPYLDVPEYPMPTPDELFTKLNGGELFTKLDLSHAYQQVVLDEKSQPYVTINTHLGLYRYTRLPFGVAAAPAIFQQMIDKMLDGLTQTGGILDDLIVTGQNDEQHIENLHHTLKKFEECDKGERSNKGDQGIKGDKGEVGPQGMLEMRATGSQRRNRVHLKPAGKPPNTEKTQSAPNPNAKVKVRASETKISSLNPVSSSTKVKSEPTKPVKSVKKMELVVAKRTRSGSLVKIPARYSS